MSLLGVDYGGKRIGLAVSDSGVLASPHSVVPNEGEPTIERIASIARETGAETIIVGVARRARTNAGEQKFHEFAEKLRQKTCKPVVLWDETLSTVEAQERLRDSGRKRDHKSHDIDMYAAAVILQSYLDAQRGRES